MTKELKVGHLTMGGFLKELARHRDVYFLTDDKRSSLESIERTRRSILKAIEKEEYGNQLETSLTVHGLNMTNDIVQMKDGTVKHKLRIFYKIENNKEALSLLHQDL